MNSHVVRMDSLNYFHIWKLYVIQYFQSKELPRQERAASGAKWKLYLDEIFILLCILCSSYGIEKSMVLCMYTVPSYNNDKPMWWIDIFHSGIGLIWTHSQSAYHHQLIHVPLGELIMILKVKSPNICHGFSSWALLVQLISGDSHKRPLMISQHWFG